MRFAVMGVLAALLAPTAALAQDTASWVTAPIYRDVAQRQAQHAWSDHRTVPTPVWSYHDDGGQPVVVIEQKEAGH